MTAALAPFAFQGQTVRVVTDEHGEPWFVAADVAAVLGYRMASDLTRRLDTEDRGTRSVRTPGGDQEMAVVNESGLYVAVLGSQIPAAREFKWWVTRELLPTIRRTGSYGTPALPDITTPAGVLAMAEQFASTARALVASQEKVAELEPVAAVAQHLIAADGDYSLREAAQILSRDHGIDTGQNRLLQHLRSIGWVDSRGLPYQRQVQTGRIAVRTYTFDNQHTGEPQLTTQVRVTAKGVAWLHANWPRPAGLSVVAS